MPIMTQHGWEPDEGPELPDGWWDEDSVDRVRRMIEALHAEAVYEDGQMAKGISVRFLARLTMVRHAADLIENGDPLVADARQILGIPESEHYNVVVNGNPRSMAGPFVFYHEIARTAFGAYDPRSNRTDLTITYRHADAPKDSGELTWNYGVLVKDGTTFNVADTGKA